MSAPPPALLDAQEVAGGVAHGRVAHAPELVGGPPHHLEFPVVAGDVLARGLADQFGEAGREGAEAGVAHREAGIRDAHAHPEQRRGPFDAPRHQVRVWRLAVRLAEAGAEVPGGHQHGACQGSDVEGLGVLAIHAVAGTPQSSLFVEVHDRHARTSTDPCPSPAVAGGSA